MHGIKSILTEFENLEKFYEVESEDKAKFSLLSKTKKAVPTQPIEPFLLFLRQNS